MTQKGQLIPRMETTKNGKYKNGRKFNRINIWKIISCL